MATLRFDNSNSNHQLKAMRLTKRELEFIQLAISLSDGVYDYSMDDEQFKDLYGMTFDQVEEMLDNLNMKVSIELSKKNRKP